MSISTPASSGGRCVPPRQWRPPDEQLQPAFAGDLPAQSDGVRLALRLAVRANQMVWSGSNETRRRACPDARRVRGVAMSTAVGRVRTRFYANAEDASRPASVSRRWATAWTALPDQASIPQSCDRGVPRLMSSTRAASFLFHCTASRTREMCARSASGERRQPIGFGRLRRREGLQELDVPAGGWRDQVLRECRARHRAPSSQMLPGHRIRRPARPALHA